MTEYSHIEFCTEECNICLDLGSVLVLCNIAMHHTAVS